jgi:hypothetical protein
MRNSSFSPTRFVNTHSPCLGADDDERTLFQPFPMRVIESECWTPAKESTKKGPAAPPLFASNPWREAAWNAKEIKGRSPLNYDAKRTE